MEYELSEDKKILVYVNCDINTIDIPDSVEVIGNYSFRNSAMNNIYIPNIKIIEECAFRNSHIENICLPDVVELREFSFSNCVNLHTLIIPNVTKINQGAFLNCDKLTYIKSKLSNEQLRLAFNNVPKYNAYIQRNREYKLNKL
ncbi:MAG: leucine-rich repeat domain-containing protein [Candidatus Muirbacterium halophilum]|nr:leucine-rich repeat domain-containing protein [Candidatus Muirbacterium halophilum]